MDLEKFKKELNDLKGTELEYLIPCGERYIHGQENIRDRKVSETPNENNIDYFKNAPIPKKGRPVLEVARELHDKVLKNSLYLQHPRFFSYVCNAISPYSYFGHILTSAYNLNGVSRSWCIEASTIEENLIRFFASKVGFDTKTCGGYFTPGGSTSNLNGICAGRDAILKQNEFNIGTAYLTDQAHACNPRALHICGFTDDRIRFVPCDENFKMIPEKLEELIKKDIADGKKPAIVIANFASTNTGEIDPFEAIGKIKEKYHMWMHIDGAYGASLLLSDKYRHLAKGTEYADSISWDMHKWLMQNYSCSVVIVKDIKNLANAFTTKHEYLDEAAASTAEYDAMDIGIEMSRPHRALPFWMSIQSMGLDEIEKCINNSVEYAEYVYDELKKCDNIEITSKPSCAALTFRFVKDGKTNDELNDINATISKEISNDGTSYMVTTVLNGKKVLRLCILNGTTTKEDMIKTIEIIKKYGEKVLKNC